MSLLSEVSDVLFGSSRGLEGMIPNVVIEEGHDDELVITDHPVEAGASISDHSFRRPCLLKLRYGWSPGSSAIGGLVGTVVPFSAGMLSAGNQLLFGGEDYLTGVYSKLRALQQSGAPFPITTGKRLYPNMMLQRISFTTTRETEYSMLVNLQCREVLIVNVRTSNIAPQSAQANPSETAPVQNAGTKIPQAATNNASVLSQVTAKIGEYFK